MASFADLTDEERRRALQREDEILQGLEDAKAVLRSCEGRSRNLRNRNYQAVVRGASHEEYNRAERNLESAKQIVESLSFDLLLYRLQRNDKDTSVINCQDLPQGYGEPFGKALAHNNVVTTLTLTVQNFLPTGIQTVFPAAQPLHDFVSTSPSLVNVRVCSGNGRETPVQVADQVASCMLETVCASNVIQKLVLYTGCITPMEFKSLLTKPQSLRELDVTFESQRWADEEKQCVIEGLKANENRLQRLMLSIDNGSEGDGDMPAHVLENVHLLHSLQELELAVDTFEDPFFGVIDVFNALERYLQSANMLRRLELVCMRICESSMASLLSGLGQTTANVSEVIFNECSFATGSSDQLFAFLQTPTTDERGTTIYKSALRKLCVGLLDQDDWESWQERLAESVLEPVESTPPGKVQTVGSQIEELHISDIHPSFFRCMGINAGRVRVKHLGLYERIPDTISECLPKLRSVTSLTVKNIYVEHETVEGVYMIDCTLLAIVEGIKRNGSITAVTTGRTDFGSFSTQTSWSSEPDSDNDFHEEQLRLMNAYALRNKFLSSYQIGQASAGDDNEGVADSVPIDASNSDYGPLQIGVSQAPSILRTAMIGPVPHLWHGLAEAGEQCGPDHHVSGNGASKRRLPT